MLIVDAVCDGVVAMLIEVLYVDGCPNHGPFLAHLGELLERAGVSAPVRARRVGDDQTAQAERFLGSPTLRINGRDVDPAAAGRGDFGLQCRVYATAEGLFGSPPDEWVLAALRAAAG
ncbi:hypothetical protein I6A60_30950 [Frankia sp. AgB1.9]|uniref:DF family (seleno)protein n=1 Tax=unclassified Frankia TaxID=2632575 RepID=UPI00193351CF|nr:MULTISPECIES: hypothetical protein [unclassified Frankia]MBL7490795.1 hypothetical protein [Frankia sp. AgW1.1]MBL7552248.1 hypothetical protein [Frankia sp. AgB1.9]MBL7621993.1 hypothetical protein [Frankia sp. AgB1.8]